MAHLIKLPVEQISLHPQLARRIREAPELLPTRFPRVGLGMEALQHILLTHPMLVASRPSRGESGQARNQTNEPDTKSTATPLAPRFWCVGGLPTFQLAVTRLAPTAKVPAIQLPGKADPEPVAWVDLLLGALLSGIHGPGSTAQLGRLWDVLPEGTRQANFPGVRSKAAFTRALGLKEKALLGKRSKPIEEPGPEGE